MDGDSVYPTYVREFTVGKFENSLPEYFSAPRPLATVIYFDADLYSSTICALNFSKPMIDSHTILIFDEFLMNEVWEEDRYRVLMEFCAANACDFEVIVISLFTKQIGLELVGI